VLSNFMSMMCVIIVFASTPTEQHSGQDYSANSVRPEGTVKCQRGQEYGLHSLGIIQLSCTEGGGRLSVRSGGRVGRTAASLAKWFTNDVSRVPENTPPCGGEFISRKKISSSGKIY